MRNLRLLSALVLSAAIGGCIHMKGVVLQDTTNRPFTTARITVGRPGGIGVLDSHNVDDRGRFDFYIGPTDDNDVYVYDTNTGVEDAMHLDRNEISDKMTLRLRPTGRKEPGMLEVPAMP